jgi:hypothetical protein
MQSPTLTAKKISFEELLFDPPKEKPEPIVPPEDAAEQLPDFMAGHELSFVEGLDDAGYTQDAEHEKRETFTDANLISSRIKGTSRHRPIIDIDFPAMLVPSSTEGHSHLYLDKELTKDQMERLLEVLHEVGIIADGNLNQWERFKAVFLRLPWVKKSEGATEDSPKE